MPGITVMPPALTPTPLRTSMGMITHFQPNNQDIRISLWEYPNGEVKAELSSDNNRHIGTLEHQFPNMPAKTILVHTVANDSYKIIGVIDRSFPAPFHIIEFEPAGADPADKDSLKSQQGYHAVPRLFSISIEPNELANWQSIRRIAIKTRMSIKQGAAAPSGAGNAWEQRYDPAVELAPLIIEVK
ncbi:hypothetical protein F8S13_04655 [Chloroflexia bacterium SDU3-3]|nr:hypothetical protein F8S13_04655 [Chloroflexia bacterium SDU3-3]